jgi:hypothetical protein
MKTDHRRHDGAFECDVLFLNNDELFFSGSRQVRSASSDWFVDDGMAADKGVVFAPGVAHDGQFFQIRRNARDQQLNFVGIQSVRAGQVDERRFPAVREPPICREDQDRDQKQHFFLNAALKESREFFFRAELKFLKTAAAFVNTICGHMQARRRAALASEAAGVLWPMTKQR